MVNWEHTCRAPGCSGRMVKAREQEACVSGTCPDETGFTVTIYACDTCGAEDWE